jgi:CBS domain-containing protein
MVEKLEPPTVDDLMITEVFTVAPDASLDDVIATLIERNIPAAPVVEEKHGERELLGLITEKDCLEYFSNEIYYGNPDVSVQSMMQRFPLCVSPETDVFAMATIFTRHPHRHLPVVKKKQLVGIVSRREVLRGLYEFERKVSTAKAKSRSLMDFRQLVNHRFIIK